MRSIAVALAICILLGACGGSDPAPLPPPRASVEPPIASSPRPTPSASASAAPSASASASALSAPPRPLSFDDKKKIVLAVADAFNAHDAERLAAQYTDGSGPPGRAATSRRADLARERAKMFAMIPDVRMNLVRVYISPGSVLTLDWILSGTDTKGIAGAKPSGAKVAVRALTGWWLDPMNAPLVAIERTYYDLATLYAQAGAGRANVRPLPTIPTTPNFDWASNESQQPDGAPSDDDVVDAFHQALVDDDMKAAAAKLADGVVWSDLTKRDDFVGKKSVLAMLAAQAKAGRKLASSARSSGLAYDSKWTVTRGSAKVTALTGELVDVKDGVIVSVTSFGEARE